MAFDPAQILRQTYAGRAEAMQELAQATTTPTVASPKTGELLGTAFIVEDDPMAEFMDSMEELSFQFEEKAMKRITERKLGEMQGPRSALVRAVETWAALMPDMPGRDFLARTLRSFRNSAAAGTPPDAREILKALARGSSDPSHQFAMLDILEQSLGEGEDLLRTLLTEAKTRLLQEKGAEVRAGINLASEVNARASTPAEMQDLRDLYRSEVVGFTKPQECFRSLLAQRGPGGLQDAINFLIAGCGADLEASNPSLAREALDRILGDLQCVQVLQTVLDKLTALGARMGTQFGDPCRLNGEQLSGRVLDLTEQAFVAAGAIAGLIGECGMRKLLAQMDFARELTALFRQLSPRLFARESDRQRLVDAAQEHLDGLVSLEEEAEEEEQQSHGGAA
ncbi:MAG: TyeA family type III secretion system gatekeeper subunit [Kiritimatiellae bacterium]|nr:TyeA family type III secretion system gatekeeper subunit [Kiritimatiellia bacterium]